MILREIKFRGWDETFKKMYHNVYFDNLEVYWRDPISKEIEVLGDRNPNGMLIHIEIMQYTGIKDIKGVEIYEGDIISYVDFGLDEDEKIISQVNWIDYKCGFSPQEIKKTHKGAHRISYWDLIYQIKIIGNIRQNPEMIP